MAHVEFTREVGGIQTIVEGPPVFSGGIVATGCTMIVSQGFAEYLKAKGIPYRPLGNKGSQHDGATSAVQRI